MGYRRRSNNYSMLSLCKITFYITLCGLLCFNTVFSQTIPSNFEVKIGGAISCDDNVNADYLIEYMNKFFGSPEKTEGGAYWWRLNAQLFNTPILFVFISQRGSGYDFIGATFKDAPEAVMARVTERLGPVFQPLGKGKWESSRNSVLLRYYDRITPSKMYCSGARTAW